MECAAFANVSFSEILCESWSISPQIQVVLMSQLCEGQLFVEIRQKPPNAYTEAFILTPVSPKDCRSLILRLNEEIPLPRDTFCHLKRVRKDVDKTISMILYPKTKKTQHDVFDRLRKEGYQIVLVKVPARLPETANEWNEFNAVWPTKYILTAPPPIEISEQKAMLSYLLKAKDHGGVIIVDPQFQQSHSCHRIIATADQEAKEQGYPVNPLATNVLLAIQGVSRLERETALELAALGAESKQQQYLCTNYDVYCTKEPSVFECMALLHSRIRRLVFAQRTEHGGITTHMIHALQLTNHRYRAFGLCATANTGH